VLYRALQQQSADIVLETIRAGGGIAFAHEADLANTQNIPLVFDLCESRLGDVDILVNNHTLCVLETFDPALVTDAGSGIHLVTAYGIDAHFAINARAYALLMAEYLQRYLRRGATSGRISTSAPTLLTATRLMSAMRPVSMRSSRIAAPQLPKSGTMALPSISSRRGQSRLGIFHPQGSNRLLPRLPSAEWANLQILRTW
jgi:NAD(P)-dependent dehydrogenase (short-subunit alcohol dehydrogenase family)